MDADIISRDGIATQFIFDVDAPFMYTTAERGAWRDRTIVALNLPNAGTPGTEVSPGKRIVISVHNMMNILQTTAAPVLPWQVVGMHLHGEVKQLCVLVQPDTECAQVILKKYACAAPDMASVLVMLPLRRDEWEERATDSVRENQRMAVRELCEIEHATPRTLLRKFGENAKDLIIVTNVKRA